MVGFGACEGLLLDNRPALASTTDFAFLAFLPTVSFLGCLVTETKGLLGFCCAGRASAWGRPNNNTQTMQSFASPRAVKD